MDLCMWKEAMSECGRVLFRQGEFEGEIMFFTNTSW